MAEKNVVLKVWIEPGCIICDACQTTCPDIFEVQGESCIIRPEALDAELLRRNSEAIELAAEECPVEVIRFQTEPDPG